jgi:SNF2 family DNA or RNA helicase
MAIQAPAVLAKLRERLMGFEGMKVAEMPEGLGAELRPYQVEGVSWLQFLREFDLHGVLADDMGLGKTLQTITHLLKEKVEGRADRPSLVVAPTSVVRNWVREMKKFAPDLRVLLLHGGERRGLFKKIRLNDVVVTTFPLLVRDVEVLKKTPWHLLVLDEAQNIKNPKSQAALAAREMDSRHRLCLTGTPMENHLGELWSLFEFLMPGFLGDAETFRRVYRNPIEKKQDEERQGVLAQRVGPLLLRRTKDAVAKDLPPKTEIVHRIEMEGPQADLYETIRAVMDQRVREAIASQGMDRSHIVVLDALLKLRQVCCHPALLKAEAAQLVTQSAKLAFLIEEMLPELLAEGRRVLIFSQFTTMLALIEKALKERKTEYVKLTGETKDRETPVQRFQAGEVPVFLISLKAGGAGLNLTAADTVIHYDPWWNPAVEAQASDRAHRIGQTKPIFVHKLICEGTIEEKILALQQSKAAILEGLLGGKIEKLTLTQEDVKRLLEPLS